jgi:hypothetical protein
MGVLASFISKAVASELYLKSCCERALSQELSRASFISRAVASELYLKSCANNIDTATHKVHHWQVTASLMSDMHTTAESPHHSCLTYTQLWSQFSTHV